MHRLVDVHGSQTGCIESGQPHIPHYHNFQGIIRVLETLFEVLFLRLVGVVRLKMGFVRGGCCHDDLNHALLVIL